jgi:hypothetical protein
MAHITHTVTGKDKDGNDVVHTAEAVRVISLADGAVAIAARCCGDESTTSHHTVYDITLSMTEDDLRAQVQAHVERVANHHASAVRAKGVLADLVKE